jgi:predicted nuclease of restriction endonuclease-like (RecB) superfamily
MDYYNEIKNELVNNEINKSIKDYSKNKYELQRYYNVGKLLLEVGNQYGENIIGKYADKLMLEVGKKYDKSTLFKIRKFYLIFSDKKVAPLVPQLSWSHCLILLPLKDINKINYYMQQISKRNLSKRQLQEIIKLKEYERLSDDTKRKLIERKNIDVSDLVKNPIMIRDNNGHEIISEKILQKMILEDIPSFLEELGEGFTFIKNEYPIKLGDRYNYIDLLLFNIEYNCYVVVELKVTELKKEHIGQIQVYMNYIDENLKKVNYDKTIGIIICKQDNEYVIKYCSDDRIISRRYELI